MTEETAVSRKNCPICSLDLPISDFGVCRARKDGRNLYCKGCIRKKVTDSRRALKEYRSSRKRSVGQPTADASWNSNGADALQANSYARFLNKLSPVERVRETIRKGARTQKEIRKAAGLGDDEVGEALASLLLWTREIKTQMIDNNRHYFINEADVLPVRDAAPNIPGRKKDVPSSFSAITGLMPGKTPEGEEREPQKVGGWVAA